MRERAATIDEVLRQAEAPSSFLSPRERQGGWRELFGAAADRVPSPYWLFGEDEQKPIALGFPLRISSAWESLCRDLGRLIEAEGSYRRAVVGKQDASKTALIELRNAAAQRLTEVLENALLHDHGRTLPEILWLALSREIAEGVRALGRAAAPGLSPLQAEEVRWTVAHRLADLAHRAEIDALGSLQRWGAGDDAGELLAFGRLLRQDLLPLGETRLTRDLHELDGLLQGFLRVDPARFHKLLATATAQLNTLRERDAAFHPVLALMDPAAPAEPSERLLLAGPVLALLAAWPHPETPRLPPDLISLLKELGERIKRFEIIAALRDRLLPLTAATDRVEAQIGRRTLRLSSFTRPLDFGGAGVLESTVRRFGLVYDLVEFTQILETLRRRGRGAEENGLRFMARFQRQVEEIRARHRLTFEKFLGDGAFYSSRSARATLLAGAELRLLYERLRTQGFPFDHGMRLALSVGSYHLLPMATGSSERGHFEFFGHGLVELARLTSGKTTHEVEDIADFLISAGYDVHRVLEFLEPVRHGSRHPDHVRARPYAAFLAENRELVNLGGVATEAFLRDLEGEWSGPVAAGECYGLSWLLLPCEGERRDGAWVGLRLLGTARLKGLEPTPIAEIVVLETPPDGMRSLPNGALLLRSLQELAGGLGPDEADKGAGAEAEVDPRLAVVSVLEPSGERIWYIGRHSETRDALLHAFSVPLNPVDLDDGEPFESWLFRRRAELGMLYQGLRRDSAGTGLALAGLRGRDGYFTCLLAAPHRSPP